MGLDSPIPCLEHYRCHIKESCFSDLNWFEHSHSQDIAVPDRVDPALPNSVAYSGHHSGTCDNERFGILDPG